MHIEYALFFAMYKRFLPREAIYASAAWPCVRPSVCPSQHGVLAISEQPSTSSRNNTIRWPKDSDFAPGAAANSTKQRCLTSDWCRVVFDCGLFAALYENMTSYTKPEVHNVLHCLHRTTESRPHVICPESLGEIWIVFFRYTSGHTYIHTYRQTDRQPYKKDTLLYGTEACPVNSAVRHSLQFALNRALFKIFGALSKDTYQDICKYFGIWTVEEQISARKIKFNLRYCTSESALCQTISKLR